MNTVFRLMEMECVRACDIMTFRVDMALPRKQSPLNGERWWRVERPSTGGQQSGRGDSRAEAGISAELSQRQGEDEEGVVEPLVLARLVALEDVAATRPSVTRACETGQVDGGEADFAVRLATLRLLVADRAGGVCMGGGGSSVTQ